MSSEDDREMPELVEGINNRLDQLEQKAEGPDTESSVSTAAEVESSVEELLEDLEAVENSFQNYDDSMREYVSDWTNRLENALDDIDSRTNVTIRYDSIIDGDIRVGTEDRESTYGVGFANKADKDEKSRRGYLRDIGIGLGAFGGLGIVGLGLTEIYNALTGGEQPPVNGDNGNGSPGPADYDIESGEVYSWDEFNQCLSEDQVTNIEERLGDPESFKYEVQTDGELYDTNVLEDNEVIAYLDNEGLECEVRR